MLFSRVWVHVLVGLAGKQFMESGAGQVQLSTDNGSEEDRLILEVAFLYIYCMFLTLVGAALLETALASFNRKTAERKNGSTRTHTDLK